MTIGGNKLKLFISTFLTRIGLLLSKIGELIVSKSEVMKFNSRPFTVESWSAILPKPFVLIISFTTNKGKYQIVLVGDYREKYKLKEEKILTEDEAYDLIINNKKEWFKTN